VAAQGRQGGHVDADREADSEAAGVGRQDVCEVIFADWILTQSNRADCVGDLARFAEAHDNFPRLALSWTSWVPLSQRVGLDAAMSEWIRTCGVEEAERKASRLSLRKPNGHTATRQKTADHTKAHTALVSEVVKYIKLRGGWAQKVNAFVAWSPGGAPYSATDKGTADVLGLVGRGSRRGVGIAVECKTGEGRLSEAQIKWRDNWRGAGGLYVEARSVVDVEAVL
jgi:hypothetical protein